MKTLRKLTPSTIIVTLSMILVIVANVFFTNDKYMVAVLYFVALFIQSIIFGHSRREDQCYLPTITCAILTGVLGERVLSNEILKNTVCLMAVMFLGMIIGSAMHIAGIEWDKKNTEKKITGKED